MTTDALQLSPFQQRVLLIPETCDVFLGGGRGGAKSYTLAVIAMRHIEQYGPRARILYLRQTYPGIADFEALTRELFGLAYSKSSRYNAAAHSWRFDNGAYMELGQLEGPADYGKYQGRTFSLILVDEAGQYASPEMLDKLRSNLRGPADIPLRVVMAANPGDAGHYWLASRYVLNGAKPWQPFHEPKSGRQWVYAPSTYRDNPFIDQAAYRQQLEAACPGDPELLTAWLDGNWAIARGAFFAGTLDENRNAVDPWPHLPDAVPDLSRVMPGKREAVRQSNWRFYLSHDYGSAAPSVTYLCAVSPGAEAFGQWFPRGSIILIDELATNVPGQLNQGLNWTVPQLAEAIRAMCEQWGVAPVGVCDDACFSHHGHAAGSIADEFMRHGIRFYPAGKADRVSGWEAMRTLLLNAGSPDLPGLYVSRACEYFWQTAPFTARDPRRPQDVDSRGPDHGIDACRYALGWHRPEIKVGKLMGW